MYRGKFAFDWASLTVGSKFTVFALSYFVFEDNFQVQAPGGLIFGGAISRSRKVFCVTSLGGFIFGGACTWGEGGYFRNFTGFFFNHNISFHFHIGYVTCFNE